MHQRTLAVIGLGYVGLPVAAAFAQKGKVIAFDIQVSRITELQKGFDRTREVSTQDLANGNFLFTFDAQDLKAADFYIVAVPTPINQANQPDLHPILSASKTIASYLKQGDIIVYESTVYPGATEEQCVPVLEKYSGLKCGKDFFVGYSPERINPGDKEHTFKKIQKIVSGQTSEVLNIVANVYSSVVKAGVYKASSIKVAEAAKVIENTQRDLNIAFVNELAMIFHQLGIDTKEVLDAAGTKWNFLPFKPGLVGGHCIGVDPYYLTHKAESVGYHSQVILAGRRVNDGMGKYIAEQSIKLLSCAGVCAKNARVGILGFTFKENCPDFRNTKVIDIIRELQSYSVDPLVYDPHVCAEEVFHEYGVTIKPFEAVNNLDILILAVAHAEFLAIPVQQLVDLLKPNCRLLLDVKSILNIQKLADLGVTVWRL
ncbi:MAG: UDP-glucose/GDP-mannose dehydrogenase [Gammaproteobacteria bacterium]|jgi:UDP-N-acetyl-D-galactosamine dehydrogenase|nr:UDP-glucose/GDP-mannose dehydrogenase [Gammaproteobacteria bacterium]